MAVKSGENTKLISRFKAGLIAKIKSMGLKQADVAKILNINTGSLSKILSRGASAAIMEEVSDKLGLDLVDLLIEGRAILAGKSPEVPESESSEPVKPSQPSQSPQYGAALDDIRDLLALQLQSTKEAQADRDQRIKEFEEHIESLKKGMSDILKGKQEELNRLVAAHNQVVDQLQAQVDFHKADSERLKGNNEEQKKTMETQMVQIARDVHTLVGGDVQPRSSN